MLNTKYFIVQEAEGAPVTAQINPEANGAAWFVDQVAVVDGPRAEIEALSRINTKTTAVVDRPFEAFAAASAAADPTADPTADPAADPTATIDIVDYKVNHLTYEYSSSEDVTAVFSEIYYPKGWKAYIDGVEAPYFRANYILRAMNLPAGAHTVEFKFEAPNFDTLGGISLASSLIILLGIAFFFVKLILKRNGTKFENA